MRLRLLPLCFALAIGCSDTVPTSPGTVLLAHTVPVGEGHALGTADRHEDTFSLGRGGTVKLRRDTATAPGGGRYVLRVEIEVVDAAGFELEAGPLGTPANEGTRELPRWVQAVSVTQNRTTSFGTREGGTSVFDVRGDGTVTPR
ncbi:MAG: hypothetical protein AAF447_04900 [Myxococcota bacterium]